MYSFLCLRHVCVPYIVLYFFSLQFNFLFAAFLCPLSNALNEGLEHHNAAIPEVVLTPRGVAWELLLNKRIKDFLAK